MKHLKIIFVVTLPFALLSFCEKFENESQQVKTIKNTFSSQINSLDLSVKIFQVHVNNFNSDSLQLQQLKSEFLTCRTLYKKMEWWVEYFNPLVAHQLNEAPVLELDEKDLEYTAACGFQVIESMLWADGVFENKKKLLEETDLLQTNASGLKFAPLSLNNGYLKFDA